MRIIKHGECLKFYCRGCGCVWLANKSECREDNHSGSLLPTDWSYRCPDCGQWTVSKTEAREGENP